MPDISREQLRAFARDGYIVVSQVVSSGLIEAARQAIADRSAHDPPRPGHRGPHFDFLVGDLPHDLVAPLFDCATLALAESLIAPASFERPDHVQVSLNIPPWPHQPGGPHIDGLTPPETNGRPGTFTMLAGIFLTDQSRENAGNLWVWPGSHLAAADYLRQQGPDALLSCVPYPPVELGEARQVTARPRRCAVRALHARTQHRRQHQSDTAGGPVFPTEANRSSRTLASDRAGAPARVRAGAGRTRWRESRT